MTVAAWPVLILLMSDSLNATVIVSVPVLTISANGELDPLLDDELDPPRLPAVAAPPARPLPPDEELDDELELDALELEPADTESPGNRLAIEAIVPVVGAKSLVSLSAAWALFRLAWALNTDACAEAMLAGDGVVVVCVVVVVAEPPL